MKKILLVHVLLLTLCLPGELYAQHSHDESSELTEEGIKLLEPQEEDITIGNSDAPLTMVEYASMSCGHCASFHANTLPYLEENYISNGKLKLIFRHFPLNGQALKGSTLIECIEDKERQQKFIKTLFKSLDKWAYNKDFLNKLKNIARIGGLKAEKFDQCMNDKALEEKILNGRLQASNHLKVESTPTIFLNGERIIAHSNEEMGKIIDSLL